MRTSVSYQPNVACYLGYIGLASGFAELLLRWLELAHKIYEMMQ